MIEHSRIGGLTRSRSERGRGQGIGHWNLDLAEQTVIVTRAESGPRSLMLLGSVPGPSHAIDGRFGVGRRVQSVTTSAVARRVRLCWEERQ